MDAEDCTCPIDSSMSWEELKEATGLGKRFSERKDCKRFAGYICSNLDRELRRADLERSRRSQYEKRLRAQGLSKEEIKNHKSRRRTQPAKYEKVEL